MAYELRISDWIADVCSSDLLAGIAAPGDRGDRREPLGLGDRPAPARMAAAAEPAEIDARAIDAIGFRDMVEKLVQLFDIPILIGAEQRRDGEKGEAGNAVGYLRRAVDLDLRELVATLAPAREADPQIGQAGCRE